MDFVRVLLEDGAASGVTGTEITVFESLARAFSEEFLVRFLAGEPAGRAIYGGLTLLKSGNPLVWVYPYVMANLRVEE